MKIFRRKKEKEEEKEEVIPLPVLNIQATRRYKSRMENLLVEYKKLRKVLLTLESDQSVIESSKISQSNNLIAKMAHIEYEIKIREEILSWQI